MKIQCQSCQAKYTIADEKVLGKVVKIRCKKCSATIVINGNDQHAQGGGGDDGVDTHVFDYAQQSNEQWTVNVADGDQRTLTVAEISTEYKAGVINDETYCWKDGMADWLPLREIEQIYGAVKLGGAALEEAPARSVPPPAAAAAPLFAASGPAESPFAAHANGNGNGNGGSAALFGGGAAAEAPAAARRAGGRAQGADLFGNVEKAGGEDDVMTSAAAAGGAAAAAAAPAADDKLTGQRNESSVLFSLSALTKDKEPAGGNRTTATGDGSGLIDIRALSASMDDSDKKKDTGARVDDIMNLSGGGAFGAALAAPILAPPPLEAVDMSAMSGAPPQKQNKTLVFAILGGCAFIAIAIVAAIVLTRGSGDTKTAEKDKPAASAAPDGTGTGTGAAPTPDPNAAGTGAVAANDKTPAPPGTGEAPKTPGTPAAKVAMNTNPGPAPKAGDNHAAPTPPAPAPAPAPTQPKSLNDALGEAVQKPKAPESSGGGGGSTAPFDRGAAAAALGGVNVQSCKKPDGPTGSGHVTVTFGPDGSVQKAEVDQPPYQGTPVGGCIAGKYRGAHVPSFGGAPVRVGKSFTIN